VLAEDLHEMGLRTTFGLQRRQHLADNREMEVVGLRRTQLELTALMRLLNGQARLEEGVDEISDLVVGAFSDPAERLRFATETWFRG